MKYTYSNWEDGKTPPEGWDVADAVDDGWTGEEIVKFMKATVRPWMPEPKQTPHEPKLEPKKPEPKKPDPEPAPVAQMKQPVQAKPEQQTATVTSIRQPDKSYHADDAWKADLVTDAKGSPIPTISKNWALLLENDPRMNRALAFDAFKMQITLQDRPAWDQSKGGVWMPRPLRESDFQNCVMWLESMHMTPKASNIAGVIQAVAEKYSYDRLKDYLNSLEWDRVPRIDHLAHKYLGADDTTYTREISRRMMISAVARGLQPGCKVDTMLIIEGPQGLMKSSFLKVLFSAEFFTDELSDIGSKDAKMELQGVWCIEIAEMHRLSLAMTTGVKKFLAQSTDRYRPPYGRTVIEAPRRSIMAGTINPDGNPYLQDNTGARRFWPVTATKINLDVVHDHRDQLWAEAVHRYHAGEPWWVQAEDLQVVEAEQASRTDIDIWTDAVLHAIEGKKAILMSEIARELGIPTKEADKRHAARIGRIMSSIGWETRRDFKGGSARIKFTKPGFDDNSPW